MRWIVFGEDWGRHPSSTQHLFKQILPQDEVVWVNSMGLRCPRLNRQDFQRAQDKLRAMMTQAQQKPEAREADKLADQLKPQYMIQPQTLPLYRSSLVRQFNCYQLRKQLQALPPNQQGATVLWLSLPSAVDMVGLCGEQFSVYYCGDDFSALAGVDHEVISQMEAELVTRCDLVIAASPSLAEKFPVGKTLLLEHGVDYALFSEPKAKPHDFPERPVIGFYGQLADWVDIELLGKIADQHPDHDLMIIGAVNCDTTTSQGDLLKRPNVRHLLPMAHHELAAYCQHWQLALLPFKDCPQIQHCNPLKLREYLATGTEILSTRYPAAEAYQKLIHISSDSAHDSFLKLLNKVLLQRQQQTPLTRQQLKQQRQHAVAQHSWAHKAEMVKQQIHQRTGGVGQVRIISDAQAYMG